MTVLACLGLHADTVAAQQFSSVDRERAVVMLHQVSHEIEDRYFDPAFRGVDVDGLADSAEAHIGRATSLGEAFAAIAQFTLALHDSHTFFVPPATTIRVDYGWDFTMVGDACLVTKVRSGSDAHRQGVGPGDVVLSINGYRPTRANVWQLLYLFRVLRPQPGLHVELQRGANPPRQLDLAAQVSRGERVVDLTGADGGSDIARLIWDAEKDSRELAPQITELGDSVLVLRLPTFDVSDKDIRELLGHARGRSALVLDLRDNAGGSVSALRELVSQVDSAETEVAVLHRRDGVDTLRAKGRGGDAYRGRLVVLVNSRSASASEVFARLMQLRRRAIVLGDRTEGAVMESRFRLLTMRVETAIFHGVNVTEADLIMPDGGRLEGIGVMPDELLLPTAADFREGRDPVLARALTLSGSPMTPADAGRLFDD
ncbi:MAG TPA: S41 family peptidase [Gemmatimonadales bacterium]|nr:S41 family peptidase [Gemmatimonadales bacterium]